MTERVDIKLFDLEGLSKLAVQLGEKPYRGQQVAEWLYLRGAQSFSQMKNLPLRFRLALEERCFFVPAQVVAQQRDTDGTTRLLLELSDGARVETVLIPAGKRLTACISTQAGCSMGCVFCATGALGLTRSLLVGELVEQVSLAAAVAASSTAVTAPAVTAPAVTAPAVTAPAVADAAIAIVTATPTPAAPAAAGAAAAVADATPVAPGPATAIAAAPAPATAGPSAPSGAAAESTSPPAATASRPTPAGAVMSSGTARVSNVVVMGQGEPFVNYDATLAALRMLNNPRLFGVGARHITVSTAGILAGIRQFSTEPEQLTLAVSIHSTIQATRDLLMPGLAKQPLDILHKTLVAYMKKTGRRPSLEYALIADINDDDKSLASLLAFCQVPAPGFHVNLLPLNTVAGSDGLRTASHDRFLAFETALSAKGISVSTRASRGSAIAAACGQLASKPVSHSC